jgi:FkbM family methyltransferase
VHSVRRKNGDICRKTPRQKGINSASLYSSRHAADKMRIMASDELPFRKLILNGQRRTIYGDSADDPYFSTLLDEGEWPFNHICRRYVRDDYNCIDIGANVGLMTLYIGSYCTAGKILAVEPNRAVFPALQKTIQANGMQNAIAVNVAINDRDGEVQFTEESAFGHIDPNGSAVLNAVTLATLMERHRMDRVDFIKMDVEGYEPIALRGALDILKRDKPLIFMEFNSIALIMETRTEPLTFLEWILDTFAFVYLLSYRPPATELLMRLTRANVRETFYNNVMKHGCVDDLVITDNPDRLALSKGFNEMQTPNAEPRLMSPLKSLGMQGGRALLKKMFSSWASGR